jgi:hypothetical protein
LLRPHRAERALQDDLAPELVPELSVQRRDDRLREQVGGHDPRDVAQPPEVADDRRQSRGDDRLIERREEQHEHQAAKHQTQAQLVARPRLGLTGGSCDGAHRQAPL